MTTNIFIIVKHVNINLENRDVYWFSTLKPSKHVVYINLENCPSCILI